MVGATRPKAEWGGGKRMRSRGRVVAQAYCGGAGTRGERGGMCYSSRWQLRLERRVVFVSFRCVSSRNRVCRRCHGRPTLRTRPRETRDSDFLFLFVLYFCAHVSVRPVRAPEIVKRPRQRGVTLTRSVTFLVAGDAFEQKAEWCSLSFSLSLSLFRVLSSSFQCYALIVPTIVSFSPPSKPPPPSLVSPIFFDGPLPDVETSGPSSKPIISTLGSLARNERGFLRGTLWRRIRSSNDGDTRSNSARARACIPPRRICLFGKFVFHFHCPAGCPRRSSTLPSSYTHTCAY